ncbi:MAG: magnesium transporter CorA family protein [Dehalococcoides mccartyi]|jgi:Mg2+ and Co2+ transporters|uniref:Magnesium transporter n=3 Tax=root TaxID=1 RepID=A0A0V8M4V1_9CHLR|nr:MULTISPECIES: magnesium transporter CorA family protein [Dehalococcoides]AAW40295.1 magnesium and cobalt transport protein, putative [Dehalococcoides mccartyi 195]AQU02813.1 magnesium transporter [Dehalococcoides mccartyi]AQU04140.1 magnesium transporter [Dehalococcoides mccartyi]KSV18762.1 magnesium transporter [Dehalococcoides mccartyi]MBF4482581.1 magnesium transporter CorA family protein [Dehalococcoides mccartyi]
MALTQVKNNTSNIESITYGKLTWINIENPQEPDTEYLAANYPFHPLDLDDVLSRRQRPKIDEYKEYLFFVLHFPFYNKELRTTVPAQLSVFIGENYIITLHSGNLKPLVKLYREMELDEDARPEYFSHGSGFLMYRIVDRLVDYCLPITVKLLDNLEEVEDTIFTGSGSDLNIVKDIALLRRDIIANRRIIWPMRAVIGCLENKLRKFINQDMSVYFGDMTDHMDKVWDTLDETKEVIEGLSSTFDSMSSHRTNRAMRILTIVATILLPFTMVASIFGMNIPLPFQNSENAIYFVAVITAIIVGFMLYMFRRIRLI